MLKVDVLDMNGKKKSEIELNENVFDKIISSLPVTLYAVGNPATKSTSFFEKE